MPAYHFEGSSDSGFQVSGILEADDKQQAQRKAQRFCATQELVLVSELGSGQQDHRSGETENVCLAAGSGQPRTWRARARSLAASVAGALRGNRLNGYKH